jgi:hypothetical protein
VRLWSTAKRLQVWSYASILLFPVNGYESLMASIKEHHGRSDHDGSQSGFIDTVIISSKIT